MKLAIVNFSQAKRLKELGCPVEHIGYGTYGPKGRLNDALRIYPAIPVPLALKWLRDEMGIHIKEQDTFAFDIVDISVKGESNTLYEHTVHDVYDTYEEAESAALEATLTLLEKHNDENSTMAQGAGI